MTNTSTPSQPRELGFWMCTALVIGNTIGIGIFMMPAALAPFGEAQQITRGPVHDARHVLTRNLLATDLLRQRSRLQLLRNPQQLAAPP